MIIEMCDLGMQHDMLTKIGVKSLNLLRNTLKPIIRNQAIVPMLHYSYFLYLGINLIAEVPPKECEERVVYCDGGDPHLGHPKVYINLVKSIYNVFILYCLL